MCAHPHYTSLLVAAFCFCELAYVRCCCCADQLAVNGGGGGSGGGPPLPAPPLSVAVLCRVASCHKPLERALLAAKVPYIVVGGTRLCDHADVRDVLAYLQLAADPNDLVSTTTEVFECDHVIHFVWFVPSMKSYSLSSEETGGGKRCCRGWVACALPTMDGNSCWCVMFIPPLSSRALRAPSSALSRCQSVESVIPPSPR